jgi:hypothetical protein
VPGGGTGKRDGNFRNDSEITFREKNFGTLKIFQKKFGAGKILPKKV